MLKIVAGLAAVTVTAHALGDAGRGEYFFVVTIAAVLVQLGNVGLHATNTFEVARDRRLFEPLLANSTWLSVIGGISLAAMTLAAAKLFGWFSDTPREYLLPLLAFTPALLFVLLASNLLVGAGRLTAFNVFEGMSALVLLGAVSVAAAAGLAVEGFLLVTALSWSVLAVGLFAWVRRGTAHLRFRWPILRQGVRYSFRAYLLALVAFLVLRGNVFVLDQAAGKEELGRYSIALQVFDVLIVLPSSVALVIFPKLVGDEDNGWSRMVRSMLPMALLSFAAAAVAGLVARPVFGTVFGTEFRPAAEMLWWMLPGVVCVSLATLVSQYLAAIEYPLEVMAAWVVTLVAVLAISAVLTPDHGGVGAGAALSIGYAILLIALVVIAVRRSAELRRVTA